MKEIKSLEGATFFKHVSSEDNPADVATRGMCPKELTSSNWWMGPTWLKYPENWWPVFKIPECKSIAGFESEVKGNDVLLEASLLYLLDLSDIDETRRSSLLKLLRIKAWILRFVNILKKKEPFPGPLTAKELQESKLKWDLHPVQKLPRHTLWK